MNIKIFADGADLRQILETYKDKDIKGFTTMMCTQKTGHINI